MLTPFIDAFSVCHQSQSLILIALKCCRVNITSSAFQSKMQPARHRMVYSLLKEEMAREGGIHALQLRTRTPEEEARIQAQEKVDRGEPVEDLPPK